MALEKEIGRTEFKLFCFFLNFISKRIANSLFKEDEFKGIF